MTDAAGPGCVFLGDLALQRGGRESPFLAHNSAALPLLLPGGSDMPYIWHPPPRAPEEAFSSVCCHGRGAEGKSSPGVIKPSLLLLTCPRTFISWKLFAAAGRDY